MDQMRREAIARMQEMQSRATAPKEPPKSKETAPKKNAPHQQKQSAEKNSSTPHHNPENTAKKEQKQGGLGAAFGLNFLDDLLKDKERILLLILVFILGKEKADTGLLLALLYLAL